MPEQALQVAFEIKTACDEISRRLLRWHWERKPGAHSLDALLEHIAARKQESPDYYDRMPDLTGKTAGSSWTLPFVCGCCWTRRTMPPARWTCWATRRTPLPPAMPATPSAPPATKLLTRQLQRTAPQAALLFNEAIEALEEGYAGTALRKTNWRSITARQRTT